MTRYEMTLTPVLQSHLLPKEGVQGSTGGVFEEVLDGMQKHLKGSDWEPISHAFSLINDRIVLSVMWRGPD